VVIDQPRLGEAQSLIRSTRQSGIGVRTSIQGSDETPISSVHHAAVAVPSFPPLYAETVIRAVEMRPEAEIERRDEEDPV
jgi:hypothetical protein